MKRRVLAGALALALAACGQDGANTSAPKPEAVMNAGYDASAYTPGVQLYTVRGALTEDYEGTLEQIAGVGYDQVELAGFFDRPPEDVRAILNQKGLHPVASHVNWERFREEPETLIEETVAVGASYIILAWMPESERQTLDQWRDWIVRMNEVGRLAKNAGLTFAYHNHEFEFEPINGVKPYDLILAGTDPDLVKLELDVYWASLIGEDPIAILREHPGRIPLLHVKDMRSSDQAMVDVGRGDIDFQALLAAGRETGVKHYFVEHDNPDDALSSVTFAYEFLSNLDY